MKREDDVPSGVTEHESPFHRAVFLLEAHGFRVLSSRFEPAHFGDAQVVLASSSLSARFTMDSFLPTSRAFGGRRWYDLGALSALLAAPRTIAPTDAVSVAESIVSAHDELARIVVDEGALKRAGIVGRAWKDEMHDHEGFDGWSFTEHEVSANVYEIRAVSSYGNVIGSKGTDPGRRRGR